MSDLHQQLRDIIPTGGWADHLEFLVDRLVHVYGESENVDFILRGRAIVDEMREQVELTGRIADVFFASKAKTP